MSDFYSSSGKSYAAPLLAFRQVINSNVKSQQNLLLLHTSLDATWLCKTAEAVFNVCVLKTQG